MRERHKQAFDRRRNIYGLHIYKKYSLSWQMKIKSILMYRFTPIWETKSQTIPGIWEDVDLQDLLNIANGGVNWYSHFWKTVWHCLGKLSIHMLSDPATPYLETQEKIFPCTRRCEHRCLLQRRSRSTSCSKLTALLTVPWATWMHCHLFSSPSCHSPSFTLT